MVSHDILAVSSLEDEREGITRVIEALECHQWRSMVQGDRSSDTKTDARAGSELTTHNALISSPDLVISTILKIFGGG